MKEYINYELCKKCGGRCCKCLPGCCFPEDFDNDENKVIEALKTGNYSIDGWWDDEKPLYFIRPATKKGKAENLLIDPTWGGECIFFQQDVGCTLPYAQRPTGCKLLEPKEEGKCISHNGGKWEAGMAWEKYRKMFKKIIKEGL